MNFSVLFPAVVLSLAVFAAPPAAFALSPEPFVKLPEFEHVKISPKGDRIAVGMRVNGKVILNVLRLPDLESLGTFGLHDQLDVEDFHWASNDRLLFGASYRIGKGEATVVTGDLMAVNVDGSAFRTLIGRAQQNLLYFDSNRRSWEIVDLLDNDDEHVLVSSYDYASGNSPYLYRLNVSHGKVVRMFQARNRFGGFLTDHAGNVRFQGGTERDGTYVLLYRDSDRGSWSEIGRYKTVGEDAGGLEPLGFAPDGKRIYAKDWGSGPTAGLYLFDPAAPGVPELLFRHETYDFGRLLPSRTKGTPIGVTWRGERTEWKYFEPHHPDVALFEAIRSAFDGRDVQVVNLSQDRSKAVFFVGSDIDPGAFYVFDLDRRAAIAKFPTRQWLNPAEMSLMQPIALKARDGIDLRGYLTLPKSFGKSAKKMIVMVHGGPFGVRDYWSFDSEVQWLASNGYAVLQVNFRGSGGYGRAHEGGGYGEWGGKMQDDVTDATRWAIDNGFADKDAICIYGASYGAYSAMMGLIREPDLYRCGIGYVGVYDLDLWQRDSMASSTAEGRAYQRAVLGKDTGHIRKISPAWRANEIQAPVLLVHGGEDRRAPVAQFERMKKALENANKPVQTLYKRNEDHGFVSEANRKEFYLKMIEFLDASIESAR